MNKLKKNSKISKILFPIKNIYFFPFNIDVIQNLQLFGSHFLIIIF